MRLTNALCIECKAINWTNYCYLKEVCSNENLNESWIQVISKGEDVLWVSHMLCHSTPEMTLKKYARYIKNEKKQRATFLTNNFSLWYIIGTKLAQFWNN